MKKMIKKYYLSLAAEHERIEYDLNPWEVNTLGYKLIELRRSYLKLKCAVIWVIFHRIIDLTFPNLLLDE